MELRAIINFCPSEADLKRFSSYLKTALMGIESIKSTSASLASKRFLEVMCQLEVFSSAASVIFLVFLAINPIPKLQRHRPSDPANDSGKVYPIWHNISAMLLHFMGKFLGEFCV